MKNIKILQVGYGWPPKQAGGAIIYTKSLAEEFVDKGHSVTYFYSGGQNLIPFAYLKRGEYHGIKLIELVNSPNYYNSHFNYLESELHNKTIEGHFTKILEETKPDVVHFQNFPGLTPSLVSIAKEHKLPVILTLHNFIALCPTGEIFDYSKMKICDFQSCFECYKEPTALERLRYKLFLTMAFDLPESVKKIIRRNVNVKNFSESKTKSRVDAGNLKKNRLSVFAGELGKVDKILAVSERVRRIYLEHIKLDPKKIVVNHLGTKAAEFITTTNTQKTTLPIKFIFLANLDRHKGFQNLLEAFQKVDQTKAELHVYAPINELYRERVAEIEKNNNIKFHGPYKYNDLDQILKTADVGIVPSICHDSAPLVVFEFFAGGLPIIASDVGGMSDFVKDEINGYIFQHDSPDDLLNKLNRFIENPDIVSEFRKNIKPMKTMAEHVDEIEDLYLKLLNNQVSHL